MKRRTLLATLISAPAGVLVGCGSAPPQRASDMGSAPYDPVAAYATEPVAPAHAQAVTLHAIGLVGTPYRYGGNTPESGFDCSGLIAYVYWNAAQVRTPRTVQQLNSWGQPLPPDSMRSGDLVVFFSKGGQANHAGIYVGEGRFVHAPSTGGTVRLDHLNSRYWAAQPSRFRRA